MTGLTKGTTYTFTVKATNAAGTGEFGGVELAHRGHTRGTDGVSGTSNANAQSAVSWTAPAVNGGTAVSSYTVTSTPGASPAPRVRPAAR